MLSTFIIGSGAQIEPSEAVWTHPPVFRVPVKKYFKELSVSETILSESSDNNIP